MLPKPKASFRPHSVVRLQILPNGVIIFLTEKNREAILSRIDEAKSISRRRYLEGTAAFIEIFCS